MGDGVRESRDGPPAEADDSWLPHGTRSFLLSGPGQPDWRHLAIRAHCGLWSRRNAGALRPAGPGANSDWQYVPVRYLARQSDRLLFPRNDWANDAESHDGVLRMASCHCGWIFRRLHHVFELRLGSRKNVGGGRMAALDDVRGPERNARSAILGGGNPAGQPLLGAHDDPPEIRRRTHADAHSHR